LGIEVFHRPLSAYRGKWFGQQGLVLGAVAVPLNCRKT